MTFARGVEMPFLWRKRGGEVVEHIEMLLTRRCLVGEEARARVRVCIGFDGLLSIIRSCLLS